MARSKLIVCADDYGQSPVISEGIFQLAEARRIQSVSCLVNGPAWPAQAKHLATCASVAIGLHLNFTWGRALSPRWIAQYGACFPGLIGLLMRVYTYPIDVVRDEIVAQWEHFVACVGRAPDFIDGHQHVQQLPGIRESLLSVYHEKKAQGFIRSSSNGISDLWSWRAFPKAQAMWCLGGRRLRTLLAAQAIPTHTSFSGFYPFHHSKHYRTYFRQFLADIKSDGLIMCHPGLASEDLTDPLASSRCDEYAYFMSEAYLQDLKEYGF